MLDLNVGNNPHSWVCNRLKNLNDPTLLHFTLASNLCHRFRASLGKKEYIQFLALQWPLQE
jgi:hypothetical protein